MLRPGAVAAAAWAVAALAIIAVVMGVLAGVPADRSRAATATAPPTCGHLLDPAHRRAPTTVACGSALHDRRLEVIAAASVAGVAAVVGLTMVAKAVGSNG